MKLTPNVNGETQNEWRKSNLKLLRLKTQLNIEYHRSVENHWNVENRPNVEYHRSVENRQNIEDHWNVSLEKELRNEFGFVMIFRVINHKMLWTESV